MDGRVVLVTGASRGIGKAIAEKYVSEGCRVFINARQEKALLHTAAELRKQSPGSCHAIAADVGDPRQVRAMFGEIEKEAGPVDILINNAGISHIGLLSDMSNEEWDNVIRTNLSAAFYCCREAIPHMVRKKAGSLVQISSVWGTTGASCEAAYSASKGGLNALTRALAKELAPSNVQVNAIACGAIDTDMNRFLSPPEREALIAEIPACRLGMPSEVAALVYDITNGHSYLNGQIISLDGGWI